MVILAMVEESCDGQRVVVFVDVVVKSYETWVMEVTRKGRKVK